MKCIAVSCFIFIYVIGMIKETHGTCVLESDFGFIINCAFKQSGLFRIRNLGGLKAHFGLGFSLGDELGLAESLGNTEGNKRRALNLRTGSNNIGGAGLSASRISPTNATPMKQSRPHALTVRPSQNMQQTAMAQKPTTGTTMYRPQSSVGSINTMTGATSLPLGVPAFRPIPKTSERQPDNYGVMINNANRKVSTTPVQQYQISNSPTHKTMTSSYSYPQRLHAISQNLVEAQSQHHHNQISFNQNSIPSFQSMPLSVSRIDSQHHNNNNNNIKQNSMSINYTPQGFKPSGMSQQQLQQQQQPSIDLMGHTVEELAAVANVSVEVIQAAIKMRQKELIEQHQANIYQAALAPMTTHRPTTTTTQATTTTSTKKPASRFPMAGGNKVMNAPKEYYPVGYEKNFDDNFTSKVDLPKTSFHCGDQKHFPGLYADEDLGCMVFHVCALTDDGLIMKSFLCPESTLFDQTILKCNWWFYVDCKNSKTLYDSNIPVSKSYQLMKALTFFSNYKNSPNDKDGVDVEALKNSVSGGKNL